MPWRSSSCIFLSAISLFFVLSFVTPGAKGIGCYVCSSKDGSNKNCEDPFHPGLTNYSSTCKVVKKNHIGTFFANFCVKIFGTSLKSGESLMIRICVQENMDSQCGLFKFGDDELHGCILTCSEDGCNRAPPRHPPAVPHAVIASLFVYFIRNVLK